MTDDNRSSVPTMLTIRETANKTGLAEHYIRQLVLNGEVYYFKAGNKYLVNLEKLISYLNLKQLESISH